MTTTTHVPASFAAFDSAAKGISLPNFAGTGWNVRGGVTRYPVSIDVELELDLGTHSVRAA